jgi:hypothetical protein
MRFGIRERVAVTLVAAVGIVSIAHSLIMGQERGRLDPTESRIAVGRALLGTFGALWCQIHLECPAEVRHACTSFDS